MKGKTIFGLMLVLTTVFLLNVVSAAQLDLSNFSATINGVDIEGEPTIAGFSGEVIPLKVVFTAGEDESDVRVRAWIGGYRSDIEDATSRFNIVEGSTYSKLLSINMPSDTNSTEDYTLYIRVESKTTMYEEEYTFKVQRDSYNLEILDVETSKTVTAGTILNVDVVLKNRGYERLDDVFVDVRIPELGVSKKAYFGDLTPSDEEGDNDKEDAVERRIYLNIPEAVSTGIYELEITAHNADSSVTNTKNIVVERSEQKSDVFALATLKDVGAGATTTYDLVIVNSGDNIAVYEVVPEVSSNLMVSAEDPIVTVPAGSSKTVKILVQAGNVKGEHSFAVNVNSNDEQVKRVTFTANVTRAVVGSNLAILTVVLAIIFVVLLIVLIVLLTRKPEKTEEFEESYY